MTPALLTLCGSLNAVVFVVTGLDKWLARAQRRRVPEQVLWLLALGSGGVGTGLAMLLFRHKTAKVRFWVPALLASLIGGAAWALALFPGLRRW